jgi:microcystin-dependent protein
MAITLNDEKQIGSIFGNARSTVPTGYLLCDGSAISRTDFNRLFNMIGTTYGIGNGSTTFNIPDLRGVTPRGAGASNGYTENVTIILGTKNDDAIQGHKHTVASHSHGGGVHNHSFYVNYTPSGTGGSPDAPLYWGTGGSGYYNWGSTNNSSSTISSESPNTGEALILNNGSPRTQSETRVKSLGINFFIKY